MKTVNLPHPRPPGVLDEDRVGAHVARAVSSAPLRSQPFAHIVVERVLPDDLHRLLVAAIPGEAFFSAHDRIKQDLPLPLAFGPALSTQVWNFMENVIAQRVTWRRIAIRSAPPSPA